MNPSALHTHRWNNRFHAALLLGGMGLLLALIGWVLGGMAGAVLALAFGALLTGLTPNISPRLMLRLYRGRLLQPSDAPGLFQAVHDLALKAGVERGIALYYIPSSLMNAFSVGTRDEPTIAVTDGILRGLSNRELPGVLAHEISHIQHNDMWIMTMADGVSRVVSLLALFGQILLIVSVPLMLLDRVRLPWLPILLLLAAPTLSALLQLALSRNREYDADLDAARLTGDPQGLALALQRLEQAQGSLWEQVLMPGMRVPNPSLLRTHPRTEERVARLTALAGGPPLDGMETNARDPWSAWPAVMQPPRRHWHGVWY
jgi:heat shock protein HtpX